MDKITLGVTAAGGILLTAQAVSDAYSSRGYEALGGELLILPMALLIAYIIDGVIKDIKELPVYYKQMQGLT